MVFIVVVLFLLVRPFWGKGVWYASQEAGIHSIVRNGHAPRQGTRTGSVEPPAVTIELGGWQRDVTGDGLRIGVESGGPVIVAGRGWTGRLKHVATCNCQDGGHAEQRLE